MQTKQPQIESVLRSKLQSVSIHLHVYDSYIKSLLVHVSIKTLMHLYTCMKLLTMPGAYEHQVAVPKLLTM